MAKCSEAELQLKSAKGLQDNMRTELCQERQSFQVLKELHNSTLQELQQARSSGEDVAREKAQAEATLHAAEAEIAALSKAKQQVRSFLILSSFSFKNLSITLGVVKLLYLGDGW